MKIRLCCITTSNQTPGLIFSWLYSKTIKDNGIKIYILLYFRCIIRKQP